ncbi:MAG: hypothetical protein D3923_19020, partial [Candidatus Electrothrix sp. AR3]|nr:hypothetical protein [Candidatus Electrothrix sp. AR3]
MKKFTPSAFLLALALFLSPLPVAAENDLEAVLEGFDDEATEQAESLEAVLEEFETEEEQPDAREAASSPSRFSLDGYVQFGTSYNFAHEAPKAGATDWRGFSRAKTELLLDLTARLTDVWSAKIGAKGFYDALYSFTGRNEYTQETLDEYEDELELREVYVQG